jgi:hypothetical protein
MDKNLRVMIETLNFVNDYTGERYFRKYWDANTDEKKDDLAYYNSDNSDSEEENEEEANEEEQEPNCLYCACDPDQEDHLSDCKSLHYNNEEDEKEEPDCKYCQSNPSEEGHDSDCEIEIGDRRNISNMKFYG